MTINNHISELVGNTPILKLNNYMFKHQLEADIYAKLEFFNPAGSVKDRIAKAMLKSDKNACADFAQAFFCGILPSILFLNIP